MYIFFDNCRVIFSDWVKEFLFWDVFKYLENKSKLKKCEGKY